VEERPSVLPELRKAEVLPPEPPGNSRVLFLATTAFFLSFSIWALYAPFGPYFMKWFNLTAGQALTISAIPALLGSAMRVPMGILTDRCGGRRVFSILLLFTFFPVMAAMFANSYLALLLCGLFFGMIGTSFIIGITHVSTWYPQARQGTALGIYGIGNVGTILATIFVPILIEKVFKDIQLGPVSGWHFVFPVYATPALIMGFIYWTLTSDPPKRGKPKTFKEHVSIYGSSGLTWILSFLYWMTFGGFVCFALFSPTYLNDRWDIPRAQASIIFTTIFVVITALIRPVGGYLSDKVINARKLLTIVYSVSLLLLGVMSAEISFPITVGCIYGLGFCCGIGNAAVFKLIPTYFSQVGAVGGLAGAVGGVGGFCMPIIMGRLKDLTGSYTPGFLVWCAICAACLVLTLMPKLFQRQKI
ncbi:MAG: MFS transporter, partial [Candidatus Brocadiales bacterium]|nr:MFS transporter [Candidatus Brocadiales bacterium]